jgi:hypothetical protein
MPRRTQPKAVSFQHADRANIVRKTGVVRRTTVYFQVETAAALAEFLHGDERDMSEVVDEAVRLYLSKPRRRGA